LADRNDVFRHPKEQISTFHLLAAFASLRGLARVRDSVAGRYFALATLTPSSHNASMEEVHVFTIDVVQDARQRGRYRWSVPENMKVRGTSFYSFTTRREAQADADRFVEKLKAIWRPH
jgi:hypothetical protein